MCGIVALLLGDHAGCASPEIFEALGILQHRGQDAAGIVTCGNKGRLYQCKGNGMVRDVFSQDGMTKLVGSMGVGHVRYPTAGTSANAEAQPFYVNSPYGIVFAHNGNLTNSSELQNFLDFEAHRHINTDSDTEILLNVFADELQKTGKFRINEEDTFNALRSVYARCRGGFACVAMIAGFGIIGFRDSNGIRPLIYGSRETTTTGQTTDPSSLDYMMASESVALDVAGFKRHVDVQPGEAVIITRGGVTKRQLIAPGLFTPCIFELVYFARPDSIIDGISVYQSRLAMGETLADAVVRQLGPELDIDVVIPVPDTSRVSALQLATKLKIMYREGFIKNRYVGRTFIMPGQEMRVKNVRRKLNAMSMEFKGKNVLLVDDSIVRGTTSHEIIQMARDAGAKKVYFASCAPPIRYPNVYGIDMPTPKEFVAYRRTDEEIARKIGADRVIYQDLSDLVRSCAQFSPRPDTKFDTSVFDGNYVTGDITEAYLAALEESRSDATKNLRKDQDPIATETIGLYNNFGKS